MIYKTTPYILEKDGIYYSFPSEKSACEFLHAPKSSVAAAAYQKIRCHGFNVIKPISEYDIYKNKRLRKIWGSMHERCERKKHTYYQHYGGRGIYVCEEWREYMPFAKWAFMNGYKDNLTIDRIDNDGCYSPDNCRWVTYKEQANNKRTNRIVEYNGEKYTVTQLAKKANIKKTTLKERLNMGWSVKDAVEKPIRLRTRGWRCSIPLEEDT